MAQAKFDVMQHVADGLVVRLRAEVLGETVRRNEHVVRTWHPASWWQHWKQEHAPKWWLRRWPVRQVPTETVVRFSEIATFPYSKIKTPENMRGPVVVPYYRVDS